MEGADVFMSTFSQLKTFPFFNRFVNWLYPFTPKHPEIASIMSKMENSKFVHTLSKSAFMCNSDKYSFVMSIGQMPDSYKNMMSSAIEAEIGQFDEVQKDEALVQPDRVREHESNRYIQDLYRLMKLHRNKTDLPDFFNWKLDFYNKSFFGTVMEDTNGLRNIAEYYFAKNHLEIAAEIFQRLLEEKKDDAELYQKAGFCFQKMGNYEEALNLYRSADIINGNHTWTLRKIALCYRNLKQPEKAIQYYKQVENLQPEDTGIQLNIGHCQFEMGNYDEALKSYFKVEYLKPGNSKVWRPIAWISFITNKFDQAQKYYAKIIQNAPREHDYINAGHVEWVLGNRKVALLEYKNAVGLQNGSLTLFMDVVNEDKKVLLEKGVPADDIPLMLDRLRYDLDS